MLSFFLVGFQLTHFKKEMGCNKKKKVALHDLQLKLSFSTFKTCFIPKTPILIETQEIKYTRMDRQKNLKVHKLA
jgi:hypothetical protein